MRINALKFAESVFSSENIGEIKYLRSRYRRRLKIVVFVPADHTDKLIFAMGSAGAGIIGRYSLCSFRTQGTGTFKGGKGSNPVIGKTGKFEKTEEERLEMICDAEVLDGVIDKMLGLHPYEEPAYDIYEVIVRDKESKPDFIEIELKRSMALKDILGKINNKIRPEILSETPGAPKFKRAVIDLTGSNYHRSYFNTGNKKTLFITRSTNGRINIRFK